MLELLNLGFIQNALIAAFLISITCGLIAPWIMINRMSFLTGGISHASYGGVGIALYLGINVLPVTAIFCGVLALIIGFIIDKQGQRIENLTGIIWVMGMAIGLLFISATHNYIQDFSQYLFGSILAVTPEMNFCFLVFNILIAAVFFIKFDDFFILSFDEEYAKSRGINTRFLKLILLFIVAESVVVIMQLVGLMLVVALLSIPPLIAETHVKNIKAVMFASGLWCFFSCVFGLVISYLYNVSIGAAIVLILCGIWFLAKLIESRSIYSEFICKLL